MKREIAFRMKNKKGNKDKKFLNIKLNIIDTGAGMS